MKSQKRKPEDRFAVIKVEPFGMELVFYFGKDFKNIKKHINKKRKSWIERKLDCKIEHYYEGNSSTDGMVISNNENRPVILYIQERNIYTVIHEVHHIVEFTSKYFCFENEVEFKAYLQESLTRIIWGLVK